MPSSAPPARQDIEFASHGTRCAGWYYPAPSGSSSSSKKSAAIVLGHGLGAVKEMRLDAYAEVFQKAGYACVVFDYRHFGASDGWPRQLLSISKQLEDWHAALSYTRGREEVDPERIGIFGSSFGGGHVLEVAKADPRVKAVISQCPFTHGIASALKCGVKPVPYFLALAARDLLFGAADGDKNGSMVTVKVVEKPGGIAMLNGPDAWDGYQSVVPDSFKSNPDTSPVKNWVGARFIPQILMYYPGAAAAHVKAPIFFAVCTEDTCAPAKQTLGYARKAPNKVIKEYPTGHFDVYTGRWFDECSQDYVKFLREKLPA